MKDQGKPSERIEPFWVDPRMESKNSKDTRREIDSLHQRLVSAEAEINTLKTLVECGKKPPTQEATKPECLGNPKWMGIKVDCSVPTPEPRKLTDILAKSYDEFDFSKMAEAAVKEVERVIDGIYSSRESHWRLCDLTKVIKEELRKELL